MVIILYLWYIQNGAPKLLLMAQTLKHPQSESDSPRVLDVRFSRALNLYASFSESSQSHLGPLVYYLCLFAVVYSMDLRTAKLRDSIRIRIGRTYLNSIRQWRADSKIGRTCRVPSYHKLRSLTVQQKTSTFAPFVVEIYVYNSTLRVAVLLQILI